MFKVVFEGVESPNCCRAETNASISVIILNKKKIITDLHFFRIFKINEFFEFLDLFVPYLWDIPRMTDNSKNEHVTEDL